MRSAGIASIYGFSLPRRRCEAGSSLFLWGFIALMVNKIRFLVIGAAAFATLLSLAVFLSKEKKATRNATLQQNLREASLGGAPNLASAPQAEFTRQTVD